MTTHAQNVTLCVEGGHSPQNWIEKKGTLDYNEVDWESKWGFPIYMSFGRDHVKRTIEIATYVAIAILIVLIWKFIHVVLLGSVVIISLYLIVRRDRPRIGRCLGPLAIPICVLAVVVGGAMTVSTWSTFECTPPSEWRTVGNKRVKKIRGEMGRAIINVATPLTPALITAFLLYGLWVGRKDVGEAIGDGKFLGPHIIMISAGLLISMGTAAYVRAAIALTGADFPGLSGNDGAGMIDQPLAAPLNLITGVASLAMFVMLIISFFYEPRKPER